MALQPQIFTTPIEKSMLSIIAANLIDTYEETPHLVGDVLLLLPTRRSCMAMKEVFLAQSGAKAHFLPQMQPIADMDEDALLVEAVFTKNPDLMAEYHKLRPAISKAQQLCALGEEVFSTQRSIRGLHGELTLEQAMRLASDMAGFINELERDDVPFESVLQLSPASFAEHWQENLAVLKHVLKWWPHYCEQKQLMGIYARRNSLLRLIAKHWQNSPPTTPVIAAGSMGTQPATATLLTTIAHMPKGQVIVPGFDTHASDEVWQAVGPMHPQTHLKHLLEVMEVSHDQVKMLDHDDVGGGSYERARMLMESCDPGELAYQWHERDIKDEQLEGFEQIVCQNELEEAEVVLLLIREALQETSKTVAVITHDALMARRITALATRYDIEINNTQALTQLENPQTQCALLAIEILRNRFASLPLLAWLKHEACQISTDSDLQSQMIERFEADLCRGSITGRDVLINLEWFAKNADENFKEVSLHLHGALKTLQNILSRTHQSATEMLRAHIEFLSSCSAYKEWPMLEGLEHAFDGMTIQQPQQYATLLRQCLATQRWFPEAPSHPRVQILSPIEARMIAFDRMILTGLNEGEWPHAISESPWLNAPLRKQVGLPDMAAHIGLEAHDWIRLASQKEVFVTRAKRKAGEDTLPSRWLTRLEALCGKAAPELSDYQSWLKERKAKTEMIAIDAPAPNPPLDKRPTRLSVTQFDTLLRDPYSIYAQFVLGLKPVDAIDEELDAARLGEVVHRVMEDFVKHINDDISALSEDGFMASVDQVLKRFSETPQVAMVWRPRMLQLASWVVATEKERRKKANEINAESKAEALFEHEGAALTLHARIDRLESDGASHLALVDYKTGAAPKTSLINSGYAGQLPVSALIVKQQQQEAAIEELSYWEMSSGHKTPKPSSSEAEEVQSLLDMYETVIKAMIKAYYIDGRPYYAIPVSNKEVRPSYSAYEHLARTQEWLGEE